MTRANVCPTVNRRRVVECCARSLTAPGVEEHRERADSEREGSKPAPQLAQTQDRVLYPRVVTLADHADKPRTRSTTATRLGIGVQRSDAAERETEIRDPT